MAERVGERSRVFAIALAAAFRQAVQAAQQVQLAIAAASDHPSQVASWRSNGVALGGDHRDRGGRLIAAELLTGFDPGRSTDAELMAEAIGAIDDVCPRWTGAENLLLQRRRDPEDEAWRCCWRLEVDRAGILALGVKVVGAPTTFLEGIFTGS